MKGGIFMLLTQAAYNAKVKELEGLEEKLKEVRKEKAVSIRQSDGDGRHDNFGFEQAEIQERAVINEINELRRTLGKIRIVEGKNETNKDTVQIGSKVVLELEYAEDDVETLELTLRDLSDSSVETVTLNSPIGKTIFYQKIGFSGQCKLSNGNIIKIKILDIK